MDVYIDITGYKETYKRPEMLRLMRDCANGKVNLIFSETKAPSADGRQSHSGGG